MQGSTRDDANTGDWTFFSFPEGGSESYPLFISSWSVSSETERTLDVEVHEENESVLVIVYGKNDAENTMSIDFSDPESEAIDIFWNTETRIGSYLEGSDKKCWDGSLEDIACSDVGL